MSPTSTIMAMQKSTSALATQESGKTSRGKYTFVTRLRFDTSEFTQPLRLALKNVHGTRPQNAYKAYGMFTFSEAETSTARVKTNVKTSMSASG